MSLKKQFSKTKPVCKVTFTLPKEAIMTGNQVLVLGEFNNWDPAKGIPMKATKTGYSAKLDLETGRNYQFRYLIDNQKWENDWAADGYVPSPYGADNSVVVIPEVVPSNATVAKTKKASSKKNGLEKIEGIGPKIASILNEAGISTFADLANTAPSMLKDVLANAGKRYQMHNPTSWPTQAKLAANGDWDALKQMQDTMNGGR